MTLVIRGEIRGPGDKSISHRALILAALAIGPSRVRGVLQSADVESTARSLRALGVSIPTLSSDFVINGAGPDALRSPQNPFDCGNSGTTARLMAGLMAGLEPQQAMFIGDASLSKRPMSRVAKPLIAMGAQVEFITPAHDGLPIRVSGHRLHPIEWDNRNSSAQVKSAIILAAIVSGTTAVINEPAASRDHTERMLAARGVKIDSSSSGGRYRVELFPAQTVAPLDTDVPADPSSAAFFLALAALAHEGSVLAKGVCLNPTRTGLIEVLRRMGALIEIETVTDIGGEPVGDIRAHASQLRATRIAGSEIPRCIDELPLLACVASRAQGETIIADASELRVKESDRIRAVVQNLQALGSNATETEDGMRIVGSSRPLKGRVVTHGDHRLAMAFGILAAIPGNNIIIDDPACVAVSYPSFWHDLAELTGAMDDARDITPASVDRPEQRGQLNSMRTIESAESASEAPIRSPSLIIAIDGPAASGKSSTAQWVARRLDVRHVDSGAFYRAITYLSLRLDETPENWTSQTVVAHAARVTWRLTERSVLPLVDGEIVDDELRAGTVTSNVSRVAQMPDVREWVNSMVRQAAAATDVVVDGRDIGTAVFPDAPLKIFLIADPWERARRRLIQRFDRRPSDLEIAEETEALVHRDALDATQSAPARDVVTIDTTSLTQAEQVERIVALARATRERMDLHSAR